MLKNHKILSLITALTTSGILFVMSIWLWNSYKNHQELTRSKTDQALITVLFDYLSTKEFPKGNRRDHFQQNLAQNIKANYPAIEVDSIYAWIDKSATQQKDSIDSKNSDVSHRKRRGYRTREYNPWFFYNKDIHLSENDLDSISKDYSEELHSKGITQINHRIFVKQIPRNDHRANGHESIWLEESKTRPILINPESSMFLYAEIQHIWRYILSKMIGQIIFSVILILALIGTFLTLLKTVQKQNKLARLQRSFVNNMTHELKTPLSTVAAAIESIQRYVDKDNKERMNKYLDLSKREIEHLTQIVEKVLQFNADTSLGTRLNKQTFDLIRLAEETIVSFELANLGNVKLEFTASMRELKLHADEAHVRNILSNLLDNGIKYNISSTPAASVAISRTTNLAVITITDNGVGIPEIYHKNIFDVFFRVPNGDLYTVKGFGVGLAYVLQVLEQHGGTICLKSHENQGTIFTIKIPLEA